MAYRLQQQYKKFRDYCQYFAISMNPISFQINLKGYIQEIGFLNSIFALNYVDSDFIVALSSLAYIAAILLLLFLSQMLEKQQEEAANRRYQTVTPFNSENQLEENRKKEGSQDQSSGVNKMILTALVMLLLIVNSLFQQVVEGFVTNVIHEADGESYQNLIKNPKLLLSFAAAIFGIYHISILLKFVSSQKPKKRNIVDDQGREIEFTEQTYQGDIEKQNSPYKSLFKPYKSKFCHCELFTMVLKAVVGALTLIILKKDFEESTPERNSQIQSNFVAFIGMAISFAFVFKFKPFNYDGENKVTMFCYLSDILVLLCTTASIVLENDDMLNLLSWVIRIIFFITPVIQHLIDKKYGPKQNYNMSTSEKALLKKLEFTSLLSKGLEEVKDPMKNWVVFNQEVLDLGKYREDLWHQTWNIIFQYQDNLTYNQYNYDELFEPSNFALIGQTYPIFSKDDDMTPQERLVENRKIINTVGEQTYEEELRRMDDPEFLKIRENLFLDVQLEDCHDGNRFGTLVLNQFPFSSFFQENLSDYDDEQKEYKTLEEIKNLAQLNTENHKIQLLKMKRNSFRAMSGENVKYPAIVHSENKASVGSGHTAQEYIYHSFLMHTTGNGNYFHNNFQVEMSDGTGYTAEGEQKYGTSRLSTDIDYIEYANFPPSTHMLVFLNKETISISLPSVYERKTDQYYQRSDALSYHFNMNVLQNLYLEKEQLQFQLSFEKNSTLKAIQEENWANTHLENIYANKTKPAIIYQHYFFRDIWEKNYDIKDIKKLEKQLNPIHIQFFGFKNYPDDETFEKQLEEVKLKGSSKGICSKLKFMQGFFNKEILENFYRVKSEFIGKHAESFQKPDSQSIIAQDNYQNFLTDKNTLFQVLEITSEEKQQFLQTFQYNKPELFQHLLQKTKQFWIDAQQENLNQISSYEDKKKETERRIAQLTQEIQNLQRELRQKESEYDSARSNLNSIPSDPEYSSDRNSAQSQVDRIQDQIRQIEREIREKESEKQTQEEILENIIRLLQIIRNNQPNYDNAASMVKALAIQNNIDYHKYVTYVAKNLYTSLANGSQVPQDHGDNQYDQFNIQF